MEFEAVAITEMEETIQYDSDFPEAFLIFNELREAKKFCDVKIITTAADGGKSQLDAHRNILHARIPFFAGQFRIEPENQVCFFRIFQYRGFNYYTMF